MKKKISVYLLLLSLVLGMLTPMAPAQAAETPEIDISDKMGGYEGLIATKLPDEKAAELIKQASDTEYYASPQDVAYWNQFSNDYYYNYYLNDTEKAFWNALKAKALEMATTTQYYGYYVENLDEAVNILTNNQIVYFDPSISKNRVKEIYLMFQYTNPQFYFLHNGYWYNDVSGVIWMCTYQEFANGAARQAATQQYTAKLDQWVADVKAQDRPDFKIKRAHDIICQNTVYSFDGLHQSSYSMVCQGVTVCAGYAKTTNALLNAAGVESVVMLGPDHAWNAVQVHGIWYELDVTWDDSDNSRVCSYWCYNKSWETFASPAYGHEKESPYTKINLNEVYDSEHDSYYYNPYFITGGNTYYVVNDNTALGQRLVKRIEGTAALPQTVSYNGKTFYVMPEAGTAVTAGDVNSLRAFVERMYTVALGRGADAGGAEYWTNSLLALKDDGASISAGFILSPEFASRNYTNEQYIQILYRTFFNREADAQGISFWSNELAAGKSRAYVLAGFVNSNEFAQLCASYGIERGIMRNDGMLINPGARRFVERLYVEVLGRNADSTGVDYWAGAICDGSQSPITAAANFVFSDEYFAKKTTNVQFIETLYETFMGRKADEAGKLYWLSQIKNGVSRRAVMEGFAYSAEFQQIMTSYGL